MFEYRVETATTLPGQGFTPKEVQYQAFLNNLGKDGWELVQIVGGLFYFKRSLPE